MESYSTPFWVLGGTATAKKSDYWGHNKTN